MSIIFSKKCEYGLQAVLLLSTGIQKIRSADEIAEELKIPKEFVSKILQELTAHNIVSSKKGKQGGFFLHRPPSELKLIDIVKAIDGDGIFTNCVLGFPNCSTVNPCPLHDKWSKLIRDTYLMLDEETIDKFKDKVQKKILSLKDESNSEFSQETDTR